ncbi:hypothetical protein F2Q69_00009312 [Brassica cretica]|uniref:Uncharacterized protein n=1 Tax=Brassica cretica TaxID=69181 RepID=A0A8S9NUV0_BRACR|nr:hypothetical protein F2Q69_00009312 [Brassica cretica]
MQNPSTLVEGKKKRSLCLYSLAFVKPRRCRDRVVTVYYFGRMLCRSGVVLALSFIKFDESGLGDLMVASRACFFMSKTKASRHEPGSASRCVTTGTIFRSYVHCGGNSREVAHSVQGVRIFFEICVKAFSPVVSLSHL